MKRLKIKNDPKSYKTLELLSNPHTHVSVKQRTLEAGAIDLRDNVAEVDLGNGWIRAIPKNPKKLLK